VILKLVFVNIVIDCVKPAQNVVQR